MNLSFSNEVFTKNIEYAFAVLSLISCGIVILSLCVLQKLQTYSYALVLCVTFAEFCYILGHVIFFAEPRNGTWQCGMQAWWYGAL